MGKLLLLLSIFALIYLGIGTALNANDPTFWLASGATFYQVIRGALAVLLAVQLFTQPPRWLWFRVLAGLTAFGVMVWAVQATYTYTMPFLDTLAFLATSFAVAVTALEYRITVERPKPNLYAHR